MATLIGIVYPDLETAKAAQTTTQGLEDAGFLRVLDYMLVQRTDDGKVKVVDKPHPVRKGAIIGGIFGGVLGTLTFLPIAGAAAGAAIGGSLGKMLKSSAEGDIETLAGQIGEELESGGAAFIALGSTSGPDRVLAELARHGGKVHSSDIPDERVAEIQAQFDRASG